MTARTDPRRNRGNAAFQALSDEEPQEVMRRSNLLGVTRYLCPVCGPYSLWMFGLTRHHWDGHIIYHVKLHSETSKRHVENNIITCVLVDGRAQA